MRTTGTIWEALVLAAGAVAQVIIAVKAPRYVVIQGERLRSTAWPHLQSQVDVVQFAVLSVTLWIVVLLFVAMIRAAVTDSHAELRHELARLSARLDRLER